MATRERPFVANTEADRGAIVIVVSFSLIILTTLITLIRAGVSFKKGRFGLDDGMLVLAIVGLSKASIFCTEVERIID